MLSRMHKSSFLMHRLSNHEYEKKDRTLSGLCEFQFVTQNRTRPVSGVVLDYSGTAMVVGST